MTKPAAHPKFANPTIAEALCEIHFDFPPESPWRPDFVGELYKRIQAEFPRLEPSQELGLRFEVGPGGVSPKVLPPRPRIRFQHRDRPVVLQLMENLLTINILPVYPGWGQMSQDILGSWASALPILRPRSITRVGLRFINLIPLETADQPLSAWLRPTQSIPGGVLASAAGVVLRAEIQLDAENRKVITLASQPPTDELKAGAIVFDIDRIATRNMEIDPKGLAALLESLHEDVWGEFDSALGDRLRELLNRPRA